MKNTSPTAAVLLIGNELLSGRTADANLNHIARRLTDVGVQLQEARIVADDTAQIVAALNALRQSYTYVLTTGGIGPTHDDITAACVAQAFGVAIIRNPTVAADLQKHLGERATEATFKMADFPEGARLIPNPESIAPGFYLGNVYVMAGIPKIMQVMLEAVLPLLEHGVPVHSKSIDALLGESQISAPLAAVQAQFPDLDIGSYPFKVNDRSGTSLVVRGVNPDQVTAAYTAIQAFLHTLGAPIRG